VRLVNPETKKKLSDLVVNHSSENKKAPPGEVGDSGLKKHKSWLFQYFGIKSI